MDANSSDFSIAARNSQVKSVRIWRARAPQLSIRAGLSGPLGGMAEEVWAAVVDAKSAKAVKDALKVRHPPAFRCPSQAERGRRRLLRDPRCYR